MYEYVTPAGRPWKATQKMLLRLRLRIAKHAGSVTQAKARPQFMHLGNCLSRPNLVAQIGAGGGKIEKAAMIMNWHAFEGFNCLRIAFQIKESATANGRKPIRHKWSLSDQPVNGRECLGRIAGDAQPVCIVALDLDVAGIEYQRPLEIRSGARV